MQYKANLKSRGGYCAWISSVRGFAAVLVFISHLPLDMSQGTRFVIGRTGVTAFFLISGYLAVSSRRRMSAKQYLFNRFIRIYPVYWLLVLLMCLVMEKNSLSLWRIAANFTCFQEFLGQENILGASWMLPIQITFFLIVGLAGIDIFVKNEKKMFFSVLGCGILAILVGLLRFLTEKPFPTAFFLLMNVAILGACFREVSEGIIQQKRMALLIGTFEITLIFAVALSYGDMFFHYIGAYNVGMLLVWAARKKQANCKIVKKFDTFGYVFFLGASIPYTFLGRFVDFNSTFALRIAGCIIEFILAVLFAGLVTRYIENPLQRRMKRIENNL